MFTETQRFTLPPTNMAPDKKSLQEETNLPGTSPIGAMLVGGYRVSFGSILGNAGKNQW